MSGEFEEVAGGTDLYVVVLEEGGEGAGVESVEVDKLLQVGELGSAAVQRERHAAINHLLNK